jgi:branched-chain amino acid transport system ATP-binding protein
MILEVESLSKSFGGVMAVNRVSLTLEKGEIRALIGPNGAGKTTFFKLLAGNLSPDGGRVQFEGENITGMKPYRVYRKGIHKTFQHLNLYPNLTAFESVQLALLSQHGRSLDLFSRVGRMFEPEVLDVLKSVGLDDKPDTLSSALSHGERRRLDLGIAVAGKPKLLLLDEAASGLAPEEARDIMALVIRLAEERDLTIFFVEHDMSVVFGMAERISVLHMGTLIAEGSPDDIRANEEVKKIYLGE